MTVIPKRKDGWEIMFSVLELERHVVCVRGPFGRVLVASHGTSVVLDSVARKCQCVGHVLAL